jgi:hypothetical protein
MALTKIDISALKKADRICFRTYKGESNIECVKRIKSEKEKIENPYSDEIRHNISVKHNLQDYGRIKIVENNFEAFELVYDYSEEMQSIIAFLKENDEITIVWVRDNNNQYVDGVRLHVDVLKIRINRGDKTFLFIINHSVCEDNNARMIKVEY